MKGRIAVVTGGSRGIGFAVAVRFLRDGMHVAVLDIRDEAAEHLAAVGHKTGVRVLHIPTDVSSSPQGRVVGINLMGVVHGTRVALEGMLAGDAGGAIVNVASDAGRVGSSGEAVYSAAKGGGIAFTKAGAGEAARHAIRATC